MKILVAEDEKPIARYIGKLCRDILNDRLELIELAYNLDAACSFISENQIDLCLLDLNLNGEDGYKLLKIAVAYPFCTIVISANTDRAIEAFEYGVLDFIAKPFDKSRLKSAFDKYFNKSEKQNVFIKYLTLRTENKNVVVPVDEIYYFKAAGIYVEIHFAVGEFHLLDKTMDYLEQVLPSRFLRAHRSVIVDILGIKSYAHIGGGIYQIEMKNGDVLPLSRHKIKKIQKMLNSAK